MPDNPDDEDPRDHRDPDEAIRNTAYFLWQQDGCPEGRAEAYWQRAREKVMRERAYDLWLREGTPEGRAEDHWRRVEIGPHSRKRR